jgi:NitT/TauT family transport system substrate-binding protein
MLRLCAFVAALLVCAGVAEAQEKVKVGVLKLSSSAVLFAGVEKGFFKEYGIDPELVYFQAAAPIATALAAGQIDVGATGLTAALYNIVLGGEKLWIVADKGREWPGYPLTALIVQKDLWEGGLRSIGDLKGKRIGVTQLGSTFHYHLGNVLEKHGLTLADVKIVPLQARGPRSKRSGQAGRGDRPRAAVSRTRRGEWVRQGARVGRRLVPLADRHESSTRTSSRPTRRRPSTS